MRYTITSTVTDQIAHGVESQQISDAIRGWYPDPTDDVTEAVDGLQAAIDRGSGLTELEGHLGVRVARVTPNARERGQRRAADVAGAHHEDTQPRRHGHRVLAARG
ncbi:MAG: hypothetical protein M3419_06485 [Actinomycetota bacterium]|nr:hypothetical protein [Actinomycetota bacterium]